MLPIRKSLPHQVPPWVAEGGVFFVTICAEPRKTNQLCQPDLSLAVHESVSFLRERGEWWPRLLLLMPDHLHMLVSFAPVPGMKESVRNWKRFVARQYKVRWQRGFFDHRLRNDESLVEKAAYVRMNPVREGLVGKAEDWPYVWEYAAS